MRLSTVGRYALRAMVDLASHHDQGPVPRREISRRQGISSHYLAQLLVRLKRAGLVHSVLGPGGGYLLARPPDEISAGHVLRAVQESLSPVDCVDGAAGDLRYDCERADGCGVRLLWQQLDRAIAGVVDGVTLADLCDRASLPPADAGRPEHRDDATPSPHHAAGAGAETRHDGPG